VNPQAIEVDVAPLERSQPSGPARNRALLLDAILPFRLGAGLPLHIAGTVRAAALQRNHVVDYVAVAASGAAGVWTARAGMVLHEPVPLLGVALDAVMVAGVRRRRPGRGLPAGERLGRQSHQACEE
jgi:hypothetical protein